MSYESLSRRYPEYQRLFNLIYAAVNDDKRNPAELLPEAVKWLQERIREPEDLREAVERVARYLKYLGGEKDDL